MSVLTREELERAIEIAEHNAGLLADGALVVWDSRKNDRHYGFVIEVFPAATAVGGWCATVVDGVESNRGSAHRMDRLEAVIAAYVSFVGTNVAQVREGQTSLV